MQKNIPMVAEENTAEQPLCYSAKLVGAGEHAGGKKFNFNWDL